MQAWQKAMADYCWVYIWHDSLHVTCGLTACTPGSAPGPTLGNKYEKTLPFTLTYNVATLNQLLYRTHLFAHYTPGCSLRSQDKHLLLEPAVSTVTGSRVFSYAAPSVWNKLPLEICNSS